MKQICCISEIQQTIKNVKHPDPDMTLLIDILLPDEYIESNNNKENPNAG